MRRSMKRPEDRPEYLVERVRDALAKDRRVGELELDIEVQEGRVVVGGAVLTRQQQASVPLVLRDAFPDLEVENRTEVVSREEPRGAERLS